MRIISLRNLLLFLLFISTFSLTFAYSSEYFLGLKPCILCLYQRIPFFLIIIFTIFTLILYKKDNWRKIAVILCILSLFINAGIAFYHVGVEQKIFKLTEKCSDDFGSATSIEELRQMIKSAKLGKCDEPQFFLLGLTMAAWNFIFCLFLGIFTTLLLRRVPSST